jgi:hypothetical protein
VTRIARSTREIVRRDFLIFCTDRACGRPAGLVLLSHEQSGLGSRWHARRIRKHNRQVCAGNAGFPADRVCATRCWPRKPGHGDSLSEPHAWSDKSASACWEVPRSLPKCWTTARQASVSKRPDVSQEFSSRRERAWRGVPAATIGKIDPSQFEAVAELPYPLRHPRHLSGPRPQALLVRQRIIRRRNLPHRSPSYTSRPRP